MIFSKKGLTLLEMLIAVTLFSLMMVFISQIVKLSLRHKKKISGDVQYQRAISNTLDVVSQDFNGITTFFDFNQNLQQFYPLELDASDEKNSLENKKTANSFLINSEFEFLGEEDEIKFATFSFIESINGQTSYQLIKVHYFLQECNDLKTNEKTQCLLRSLVSFRDDQEIINKYILLKGIQSLKFSYYDRQEKEWQRDWEGNEQSLLSSVKWLPESVRMDVEWEGKKSYKKSYTFPVSYPLLRNQKHQLQRVLSFAWEKGMEKTNSEKEKKYEKAIKEDNERLRKLEKETGVNPRLDSFHKALGVGTSKKPSPHPDKDSR